MPLHRVKPDARANAGTERHDESTSEPTTYALGLVESTAAEAKHAVFA